MTDAATSRAVAFLLTNSTFPGSDNSTGTAGQVVPCKRGSPAAKPTAEAASAGKAAKRHCGQQHKPTQQKLKLRLQRPPMLSTAGLRNVSAGKYGPSASSGIRMHTPDLEDIPSRVLRQRVCRTSHASTHASTDPSTTAAGQLHAAEGVSGVAFPAGQAAQETLHAAAGNVSTSIRGKAAAAATAAQATQVASALRHAEPFSIGVQWDAYHLNPTPDMPGYPAGYWQSEASPFAAMATNPVWEDDNQPAQQQQQQLQQQLQEEEGEDEWGKGQDVAHDANGGVTAAAWGYDALHMAYA